VSSRLIRKETLVNNLIIIAGAGSVGLMLACELGLAGAEAVVLERLPAPGRIAPGIAINPNVVEILTLRGLMEALRPVGLEFQTAHFAQLWLDPGKLCEPHPNNFLLPHAKLEQRLAERVAELGVPIRRGHEVVGFEQDREGVLVDVRSEDGDYRLRGRYLLGCDGTNSTVRRSSGISFDGTDWPFYGVIGDVDAGPGDELFQHIGAHEYPAGLLTAAPPELGVLRLVVGEFERTPPDPAAPVTVDEYRELLERVAGVQLKDARVHWMERWNIMTRHAATYRDGNVFLVGDSAHTHFPFGGQALSTGLEDAINLGWKLAADINGWAPSGLLNSYHAERHPAGARACLTTKAQVALIHPLERVEPIRQIINELITIGQVNEHLVKMVGGLDIKYDLNYPGAPDDLPDSRLGRRPANYPMDESDLFTFLETGRGVLFGCSGQGPETGWADRVDLVASPPPPELDGEVMLMRPDGRIAWLGRADDPGLILALKAWFGEPMTCP
jgi:2-polyprenyl-6-methoxyphenol hydroxylase-like FAD-dependent oxidoreductase